MSMYRSPYQRDTFAPREQAPINSELARDLPTVREMLGGMSSLESWAQRVDCSIVGVR